MKKIPFLFYLLLTLSLFASVPQSFKYQAIVRDNSGNVLGNKNIGIRLSILKTTTSGTAVYTETHAVTTTTVGLINIEIGKGTPTFGSIANIDWGSDNYFIKIEMDDNGGSNYTLVGVSQLVSVPYALFASKAANGTQWSDTLNNIYYRTGKVGIGTNNPKTPFEVRDNANKGGRVTITGNIPSIRMTDTAYSGNGVIIGVAKDSNDLINSSGKGDLIFTNEAYGTGGGYIFGTGVPSSPCVEITDDCKVGIGTIAPVSKLDVKGGDVRIEDIGSGVIMKSPDGNCWRMTVSNSGQPLLTSVNCLTTISVSTNCLDAVACYSFNGNANDASGNNFNGNASNVTPTADRKGNANSAYGFLVASGSYIELPTYQTMLGSSNDFSVSMWLRYDGLDGGPNPLQLYPDNTTDRLLISVPYHPSANPADIYWDYGNPFTTGRLNIPIVTFFTWKHFVFIRNKAQSTLSVYVDGVLAGSKTSASDLTDKARHFRIGGGGPGTETFNGAIDDIKIFNRALSAAEVLSIYNSEK